MARTRPAVLLLVSALGLAGCLSGARERELAFLEAGRRIRAAETDHTRAEVVREVELFLKTELHVLRERARLQEAKEVDLYRKIWMIGSAAAVLATTSGTLTSPDNRGTQLGVGALGAAVAVGGFVLWQVRTREMAACRSFLDSEDRDLRSWAESRLTRSDERAPPELWREWVDRVTAIRAYPKCLRVRAS